jgi:hypothetical protein
MIYALYVLATVNVVLAYRVSRRYPRHQQVFALLLGALLADGALRLLHVALAGGPLPHEGWHRVLFHVSQTLFLAWPMNLASATTAGLMQRNPWPVQLGGNLVLVELAIGYPAPFRGSALGGAYAIITFCCVAIGVAGCVASVRRREKPTITEGILVGAVGAETLTLVGPHLGDVFRDWRFAQWGYMVFHVAALLLHLEALWGKSKPVATL